MNAEMKILIVDYNTKENIVVYHDPRDVIEKPKAGIIQLMGNGKIMREFHLVYTDLRKVYTHDLDFIEYEFHYFVDVEIK